MVRVRARVSLIALWLYIVTHIIYSIYDAWGGICYANTALYIVTHIIHVSTIYSAAPLVTYPIPPPHHTTHIIHVSTIYSDISINVNATGTGPPS